MNDLQSRRSFLAGATASSASLLLLGAAESPAAAPARALPRARPESVGVDPAGILAFVDAVEKKNLGLHSLMVVRRGKVVAEGWWNPYGPQRPHMLYSLSKSFTSTAVGLAASAGKLRLDDTVLSFFPDKRPASVSENLAAMRVRHLLTMATGHDKDATGPTTSERDWVRAFLSLPVEHAPGSKFVYNSAATYTLSAIVQKVVGQTALEYLRPRLFEPLGIQNPTWETCPLGVCTGGWGLSVKTEDIAKFGLLYLQKGRWEGRALVPESWVDEATSKHIVNGDPAAPSDWTQGYGYQFWRCRHGAFRGDGAFGQFCLMLPEQETVVVLTSGSNDLQGIVNAVWDHVLPALSPATAPAPSRALSTRLKRLALAPPAGLPDSPTRRQVSGKTYRLAANEQGIQSVRFTSTHAILKTDAGEWALSLRASGWTLGEASLGDYPSRRAATRGAWPDPSTLTVTVCACETPYIHTLTCAFSPDARQVTLTLKTNVGFGPDRAPALTGVVAEG